MESTTKISAHLRLPKKLHEAIAASAKLNCRSINAEVTWRLWVALREENWAIGALDLPDNLYEQGAARDLIEFLRPTSK